MKDAREDKNVTDAKKSLKAHITFFEALLKHLRGNDKALQARAMWATWCLHHYINDGLMPDIERAIQDNSEHEHH